MDAASCFDRYLEHLNRGSVTLTGTHFEGSFPTRSTVQAKLALDVGIEIEVQAWLGNE